MHLGGVDFISPVTSLAQVLVRRGSALARCRLRTPHAIGGEGVGANVCLPALLGSRLLRATSVQTQGPTDLACLGCFRWASGTASEVAKAEDVIRLVQIVHKSRAACYKSCSNSVPIKQHSLALERV